MFQSPREIINLPKITNNASLIHSPSSKKGVLRPNLFQAQNSANVYKPVHYVNRNLNISHSPLSVSPSNETQWHLRNDSPGCYKDAAIQIFSWNARSLNYNPKQLFIQSRPEEIICVQEIWEANLEALHEGSEKGRYDISQRTDLRGGGSLTLLKSCLQIHQRFSVNKDSNLLRMIVHGNKILWLCNCYLNLGKVSQIQKLFKTLLDKIPKDELNRLVIIGDLNIDVQMKESEKFKLLKTLAGQLGLEIVEPHVGTCRSSKLDIAIVAKSLRGNLMVESSDLSDHCPITLNISPSLVNKDFHRVSLPNSKLARTLTKEALNNATNAETLLRNHQFKFRAHSERALKRINARTMRESYSTY